MLLARDNEGRTVFNVAAMFNKLQVFHGSFDWVNVNWAEENLTTQEEDASY